MYQPKQFKLDDPGTIAGIIQANPLATLIVGGAGGLVVNHIPMLMDTHRDGSISLRCHVARANPLWQNIAQAAEVIAVFCGVQTYISPNWYETKKQHGKVVPTWNYEAVHVHGNISVQDDLQWLRTFLTDLTMRHESGQPSPWKIDDAPADYLDMMMQGVVGLEMSVTDIQAKAKLSQNQSVENRNSVIQGLRAPKQSGQSSVMDAANRAAMSDRIAESED